MNVIFYILRKVIVNNETDLWKVKSSSGDISGDEEVIRRVEPV
jgi:hypothetical protein